jgi:tRNA (cytidine32/guanosine34-2'-O)-methyltransferase
VQAKIFRGKDISLLYSQLKLLFPDVSVIKPWSSRNSSIEAFVVCCNYQPPPGFQESASTILSLGSNKPVSPKDALPGGTETTCPAVVPFLACGKLEWDSDMTYDLEEAEAGSGSAVAPLAPVQPPLAPHYREALEKVNRWKF